MSAQRCDMVQAATSMEGGDVLGLGAVEGQRQRQLAALNRHGVLITASLIVAIQAEGALSHCRNRRIAAPC